MHNAKSIYIYITCYIYTPTQITNNSTHNTLPCSRNRSKQVLPKILKRATPNTLRNHKKTSPQPVH